MDKVKGRMLPLVAVGEDASYALGTWWCTYIFELNI